MRKNALNNRDLLQGKSLPQMIIHKNNIIQWATGLGKSAMAIKLANGIIIKNEELGINRTKVLLVVAELAHIDNWSKELEKFSFMKCDLTVICYASLVKMKNTSWDICIFDEVHHLFSDLRFSIFKTMNIKRFIGLSATLTAEMKVTLKSWLTDIHFSEVALKDAIEMEAIAEPKIFIHRLELNNTDKDCTIEIKCGSGKNKILCQYKDRYIYLKQRKTLDAVITILCTEREKYQYLNDQFEYYRDMFMKTRKDYLKNKWLRSGLERKLFLAERKTSHVDKFIKERMNNKRYICFCMNIAQANFLNDVNAIHSERTDCADVIDRFNSKKINSLYAVNMLQEGQNLKDIEAGIIIQLGGKEREFIQKMGRSLRSDTPKVHIFTFKATQDDKYLADNLEDLQNFIYES